MKNCGFKQDVCSQRIKNIREQYKLTHKDVVKYCSQRNKVSLSQPALSYWENGKRTPTLDNFIILADLFAVDLNWLSGRCDDEKYSETVIKSLEPADMAIQITIENITTELPVEIPADYADYKIRRKTYSLEARANIIFLLNILKWEWENYVYERIYELQDLTAEKIKVKTEKLSKYFNLKIDKTELLKNYDIALKEIFKTKTAKFTEK